SSVSAYRPMHLLPRGEKAGAEPQSSLSLAGEGPAGGEGSRRLRGRGTIKIVWGRVTGPKLLSTVRLCFPSLSHPARSPCQATPPLTYRPRLSDGRFPTIGRAIRAP